MTDTPAETDAPRRPFGRRLLRALVIASALLGVGGVLFWFVVIPYPWTLRTQNPERTALMQQRLEQASRDGTPLEIEQRWVPLEEISPRLIRAVLVAEDHRFREHRGVDWRALAEEVRWTGDDDFSWRSPEDRTALREAVRYYREHRDSIRGRSTITQQLAKNLYFGTERSLYRKAAELVVAGRLEDRLGKDRILELYLNLAEWGPGIFGIEAASRHYFGRSANSLSLDQAAALAGTLPHPRTSNPAHNPRRMLWRKNLILRRIDPVPGAPPPVPIPELDAGALVPPAAAPDTLTAVGEQPDSAPRESADTPGGVDTVRAPGDTVITRHDGL